MHENGFDVPESTVGADQRYPYGFTFIWLHRGEKPTATRNNRIQNLGTSIVDAICRQNFNNDKEEQTCQLQSQLEFNFHG